jgi:ribosomal protein S12 methylthiotransferase accessory factor
VVSVAVVGGGPAADAVRAALADVDAAVVSPDLSDVDEASLAVVVGVAGDDGFERANETAVAADLPWLAVEVGGVAGHPHPDVPASVAAFGPGSACYRCLRTRIEAADAVPADADADTTRADARFAGAHAGRLAVRALGGEPVAGTVVEVGRQQTTRTVLPVPNCPVCGTARDRTLGRDDDDRSLDEAVAAAERAVDDRFGVVTGVGERESFPAPYYLAQSGDTSAFSDATAKRQAAGVSADWNEAYVKAVGEALERYAAGVYRAGEFTHATRDDLDDAVSPTAFVTPEDAPVAGPETELPWVPGQHLGTGRPTHLPAEFVHFPPPEERFRPSITTGLGLGNSTVGALRSGLREVVERDATMLAWYSSYDPLRLDVSDEGYADLTRRARGEDLTVTPLLVTQDVDVPVVAVAVHRETEWPKFAAGSAAGLDAEAAARRALAEALQNWMELRGMGPEGAADASGAIAQYADFPPAARRFVDVAATVPAAEVGPDPVPEGEAALDALVERAADAGVETYAVRVTTRDLAALGFEAVRVLAPAAQPLFVDRPYFGDRARRVPADLGFEPQLDRDFHPFP